jgi:hypothetical protein
MEGQNDIHYNKASEKANRSWREFQNLCLRKLIKRGRYRHYLFDNKKAVEKIAGKFLTEHFDTVYSNLVYVSKNNTDEIIFCQIECKQN